VRVGLNLPTGEGWRTANIGLFIVRQSGGQRTIPIEPRPGEEFIRLIFDEPGYALLVLSAGTESDKGHSDSWQRTPYCSKAVIRVDPKGDADGASLKDSGAGIVGKVGQKLEVLPFVNPATLGVGDDLPVRVYYEGVKATDVAVQAITVPNRNRRAPVSVTERTTDSAGTTWFKLPEAGQWLIRFEHVVDGVTYLADLTFDLEASSDRDAGQGSANPGGGR
jgi:hypothetical protein